MCMPRTNIDIDDDLVAAAMRKYGLRTKKEAVDLGLRRLVGDVVTRSYVLDLEGMGWHSNLAEMRDDKVEQV